MEKYRQSRRWFSIIVVGYFFLSYFFSFFYVGASYELSSFSIPSLQRNVESAEESMDSDKVNEKTTGKCVYDITKNIIKNPVVKRGRSEDWRLFFWVVLHIIAILLAVPARRYYYKKIFLWNQWKLIRYIQNMDGKKRHFIEKEVCMAG